MREGLRILVTNHTLDYRAGTELYVRDLCTGLARRGHVPLAYSTRLGAVADEMRAAGVPVVDDPARLDAAPDIIHGQHHMDTMTALLHFPTTPAVYCCHGSLPWQEAPPVFPNILRYIGVDDACRERLDTTRGIPRERTGVLYNFVDLSRFRRRRTPGENPRSALVFSNYVQGDGLVPVIRSACRRVGIDQVDAVGIASGNPAANPEDLLHRYDVVFGKARCALEAMASGCAVVVADTAGLGGMVTTDNVRALRRLNFGLHTMQEVPSEDSIVRELRKFDRGDAQEVSEWIRRDADMEVAVSAWLAIYEPVLSEWESRNLGHGADRPREQIAAAADYLRWLSVEVKDRTAHALELRQQNASLARALAAARTAPGTRAWLLCRAILKRLAGT